MAYQITHHINKMITYEFKEEELKELIEKHGFEHWDINNMTEENFEELLVNVEGDYLENCCEVEVDTLNDEVIIVLPIPEME